MKYLVVLSITKEIRSSPVARTIHAGSGSANVNERTQFSLYVCVLHSYD